MCVVLGVQSVRALVSQLLVRVDHSLEVIHKARAVANLSCRLLGVPDKSSWCTAELASLPCIVRCLAANHDSGALCDVRFGGVLDIVVERVDCRAILGRLAGLLAGARAVATSIVVGVRRSTIIVAKFDDDDIARLDEVDDLSEATFVGVTAG